MILEHLSTGSLQINQLHDDPVSPFHVPELASRLVGSANVDALSAKSRRIGPKSRRTESGVQANDDARRPLGLQIRRAQPRCCHLVLSGMHGHAVKQAKWYLRPATGPCLVGLASHRDVGLAA
jgi:hypothetical protein